MKKSTQAFTIIELLIVIAIIGLMFSLSNFNFSTISDKQKCEIFTNKIVSEIEEVRNNALVGKSINTTSSGEIIPESWKVEINTNSGTLQTFYCSKYENENCIGNWEANSKIDIDNITEGKVEEIWCSQDKIAIKDNIDTNKNNYIEIVFAGKDASLKCDTNNYYYLQILTNKSSNFFEINFDSINTLIEGDFLPIYNL